MIPHNSLFLRDIAERATRSRRSLASNYDVAICYVKKGNYGAPS